MSSVNYRDNVTRCFPKIFVSLLKLVRLGCGHAKVFSSMWRMEISESVQKYWPSMTPLSLTQKCQWHRWVWLSNVNDTDESDSEMSMTPMTLTLKCQWHRWVWLSDVSGTAESDSLMSMTPLSLTHKCQWHRWVWLSDVNDTAESDSEMSMTPLSLTLWCQCHRGAWFRRVSAWHQKVSILKYISKFFSIYH